IVVTAEMPTLPPMLRIRLNSPVALPISSFLKVAMATLRNDEMGNATGLFNLMRNIGGSVGISAVTTMLARGAQAHQGFLAAHMTPYDSAYQQALQALTARLSAQLGEVAAAKQAVAVMYSALIRQATLLSFVDNFRFLGVMCLLCIPTVLLLKKAKSHGPIAVH